MRYINQYVLLYFTLLNRLLSLQQTSIELLLFVATYLQMSSDVAEKKLEGDLCGGCDGNGISCSNLTKGFTHLTNRPTDRPD